MKQLISLFRAQVLDSSKYPETYSLPTQDMAWDWASALPLLQEIIPFLRLTQQAPTQFIIRKEISFQTKMHLEHHHLLLTLSLLFLNLNYLCLLHLQHKVIHLLQMQTLALINLKNLQP